HDNKKKELIEWVKFNLDSMRKCEIYATGTTGKQLEKELELTIRRLQSGPLGRSADWHPNRRGND
ncbi:MAG TPA: hypothetical protein VFD46_04155, partial [Chryseolinea sp.]|nr:hypothetical protein [Chryseolinea sp.]